MLQRVFMACRTATSFNGKISFLYYNLSFYDKNGKIIPGTNVEKLTDLLMNMGLERKNQFQELKENITIYPQEYFSPYDYSNCIHHNTEKYNL
ncbi:MAG: hypothetical protein ACLUI5_04295 [Fusicatenibacter saccharivorans]